MVYDYSGGDCVSNRPYFNETYNQEEYSYDVSIKFWNTFREYLMDLISKNYLLEEFGQWYYDNDGDAIIPDYMLEKKLSRRHGIRANLYGYAHTVHDIPDYLDVLTIVEFVFENISEHRIESIVDKDSYGNIKNVYEEDRFDKRQARYDYTIEINRLFHLFKMKYWLQGGRVKKVHSEVLDERLNVVNITQDRILKQYVQDAIDNFKKPGANTTDISMNLITQAITRCTTLKGSNKKQSIQRILDEITDDKDLQKLLDSHWLSLQKIGNECLFRHSEHNKIEITDSAIKEFLFYSYFNMIRLILQKLNMLEE